MGVYLLIVGTLDVAFRDEYNRHARQWMTSWRCTAVGLLAMMSCEVSVLILSLITIERYRFVLFFNPDIFQNESTSCSE